METQEKANPAQAQILRFIGAVAGLVAFVSVYGGLLRAAAFDQLDLPAYRTVALIPPEELFSLGILTLAPTIAWAALTVLAVSHFYIKGDDTGSSDWRYRVQGVVVVLIVVPAIWAGFHYDLDLKWKLWLIGIAVFGVLMIKRHTRPEIDARRTPYSIGWMTFAVVVAVGGVLSVFRTMEHPKLEPAAVLRKDDQQGFRGFLVAETGDAVYLATLDPIGPSVEDVPEDRVIDHVVEIPRDQILAISVDEPAAVDPEQGTGPDQALALMKRLPYEVQGAQKLQAAQVVKTSNPVTTFAPEVKLTDGDPSYPTDVKFFLENSALAFAHADGCPAYFFGADAHEKVPDSKLVPGSPEVVDWDRSRLSGPHPYEHTAIGGPDCEEAGTAYPASELTRPSEKTGRPEDLERSEGFYLDLAQEKRHGRGDDDIEDVGGQAELVGVPSYWETGWEDGSLRIIYWFFYPLSRPPGPTAVTDNTEHEGDWERISVKLLDVGGGEWIPQSVRFHTHENFVDWGWSAVEKVVPRDGDALATHPIVYSARGSHATYPEIGNVPVKFEVGGNKIQRVHDITKACGDCPVWDTWKDLVYARGEDWYGFGGAWGDIGPFIGPLGPSTYKSTTSGDGGVIGEEPGRLDLNELQEASGG